MVHGQLPPLDRPLDVTVRCAVFIPLVLAGLGLTFSCFYPRYWEWLVSGTMLLTMAGWIFYVSKLRTMPPDYGYVGLILITAFTYTLMRLRFVVVMLITGVAIASYLPFAILAVQVAGLKTVLAILYLLSSGAFGAVASHRMERSTTVGDAYMAVAGAPGAHAEPRRGRRRDGPGHAGGLRPGPVVVGGAHRDADRPGDRGLPWPG